LVVVLVIIAAFIIANLGKFPVNQAKPEKNAKVVKAGESFDVDANYYPKAPMTAIYLYQNQLLFANPDSNVLYVYLFQESPTKGCQITAGDMFYYCSFDMNTNRLTLQDPFGKVFGPYKFVPGKVSTKPIVFSFGLKYRYLISSDKKRFYLLLDKQDFALQFGERLSFLGEDSDLDGVPELEYFAPALEDFKGVNAKSTAIFNVDSDGDGITDIKFFVSAGSYHLIEPNTKYRWPILFWASPEWRGFDIGGAKKAPNGTVMVAKPFTLIIRMPASSK